MVYNMLQWHIFAIIVIIGSLFYIFGEIDNGMQWNGQRFTHLRYLLSIPTNEPPHGIPLNASNETCPKEYRERGFHKGKKKPVPLLYSFPGSGNTWIRQLVDYSSGIYSGSVYSDGTLYGILPGEKYCSQRNSVIKAHPHYNHYREFYYGNFSSVNMKCQKEYVQFIRRAIVIIRDPYASIWAEYQRRVNEEFPNQHVSGILKSKFKWKHWRNHVSQLAYNYRDVFMNDFALIKALLPPHDYLFLKYEDFRSNMTRYKQVHEILHFIGVHPPVMRIACAFYFAENSKAHRATSDDVMTKDDAYLPDIVCGIWKVFGSIAKEYGYKTYGGMNCDDDKYPPLVRWYPPK